MSEMTRADFEALIRTAETEARDNPQGYRRKVGLFAMLGYGYILGLILAVLLGLAGLAYWTVTKETSGGNVAIVKLAGVLLIFGWMVATALWVRLDPPKGRPATRAEFPELFAELDELQKRLDTIPIHDVILVPDLNAFVSQTPRLGVLGWQRNTLGIGLEMMLVLDREEMRAVLAHELGHLSGNHSRFGGWIYRLRRTWAKLMTRFEESDSWGYILIARFFRWYVPRFDAYSFALRRMNEYEADAASAELTSADAAARALVKTNVFAAYLDGQFWNEYFAGARERPAPEALAFSAFRDRLAALELPRDTLEMLRRSAMARATGYEDTHPALADRLAGLGRASAGLDYAALDFSRSAAHELFGDRLDAVIAHFDAEWWAGNRERWEGEYARVTGEKDTLATLRAEEMEDLGDDDLWTLGTLAQRYESTAAGIEAFRAYQARNPGDGDVAMVLGRLLAREGDADCLVEWARIPRDHREFVRAHDEAAAYLDRAGRHEEAAAWRARADARHAEVEAIRADHAGVTAEDDYRPPQISEANLAWLRDKLAGFPGIKAAWIAEKIKQSAEGMPICVIALQPKLGAHMQIARLKQDERLKDKVAAAFGEAHQKDDPLHLFFCEYEPLEGGLPAKVKKLGTRIV